MNTVKHLTLCALLAVTLATPVALGAGAYTGSYAIVGATVHPMTGSGAIDNATVLIENGRISAIGTDITLPDGIQVIDAAGQVVTPGLFDPLSSLGIIEVGAVEQTVDSGHVGRYGAGFDVADAINPRSVVIDVNRIEGITRALVVPGAAEEGAVIAGQAAAIRLGGGNGFLDRRAAAVVVYLGETGAQNAGGSRAAAMSALREALQDAGDYNRNRDGYDAGNRRDYAVGRHDLEALLPVLSGRTPLLAFVHRASDIQALLTLVEEFSLRLVIAGGAEAWMVADELANADVPVIVEPLQNLPASFEMLNASLANAARLQEAGVTIAIAQGDNYNPRNVTQAAGNAVANGLPWEEALRAITVAPAEIFGLDSGCCTLEVGKPADLVIWDGDPLEVTTYASQVFIAGEKLVMHSRQTLLRERYRKLDAKWPPAYRIVP